ncbi:hypothetical protein [Planktothrix mougeotii]|uniref:PIN domain-containing protein n=1 Tax=Planktothrix mougeotii LEGE 06226 TaxID=1828728 RepID=A0ABR9UIF5_9CYAN|nr:hypothetical protein [Planktothrix mougeotii]MBE9145364.1 hypothetical protein [Planktothrix mougeotii LEGE 06226]
MGCKGVRSAIAFYFRAVYDDYYEIIENMRNLGLTGGVIYDNLIAHAALKGEIDKILTLNPKHFIRLGDRIAELVEIAS